MSLWRCMTDGEHGEAHLLVLIRPWVPEGGLYEVLAYLQSHAEGSFPGNCIIQGHPHPCLRAIQCAHNDSLLSRHCGGSFAGEQCVS
jgi:hypothetical protein